MTNAERLALADEIFRLALPWEEGGRHRWRRPTLRSGASACVVEQYGGERFNALLPCMPYPYTSLDAACLAADEAAKKMGWTLVDRFTP